MSSIGAYTGAVGASTYSASKGALECTYSFNRPGIISGLGLNSCITAMVDCIKEEVGPFGIRCCLVTPGHYRTNIFAPTNIKFGSASIPDYAEHNKLYQAGVGAMHNNQPGDPRKATDFIVDVVRSEGKAKGKQLPGRLPVGDDGIASIRAKCEETLKICDEWAPLCGDHSADDALKNGA